MYEVVKGALTSLGPVITVNKIMTLSFYVNHSERFRQVTAKLFVCIKWNKIDQNFEMVVLWSGPTLMKVNHPIFSQKYRARPIDRC